MTINVVRWQQRRALAMQLVQRHMRTTPVYLVTGLPEPEIRAMYRIIHEKSPPSGAMPWSASLCRSRKWQARLSVFAAMYRHIGGGKDVMQALSPEALIKSFDLYSEMMVVADVQNPKDEFDITDAWIIARDLQLGTVQIRPCLACGLNYVIVDKSVVPPSCPFCIFRKQRKLVCHARTRA